MLARRHALLGGFGLCCCRPGPLRAADSPPPAMREVAEGILFRRGLDADAAAGNADAIANAGFVIGREAVAVIDPGGSVQDGRDLRAALRQASALPIRYVVMTHVHPDHIFGAAAFAEDGPVYVGHARLPAALAQRGEYYRQRLEAVLGPDAAGPAVTPTMLVEAGGTLDLGGRALTLTAHAPSHTDADLSVFDAQTGTLMTGDLVFLDRVPSLDGDLKGWLRTLQALRAVQARRIVPGHGPLGASWPEAAGDTERYLGALLRDTRAAIAAGVPMQQATRTVAMGERERWLLFDDYNTRNVLEAYASLQWE